MQDRLTGELRLLGTTDTDGANKVLPGLIAKRNEKFAAPPAESKNVCVKPAERMDMDFLFARRLQRSASPPASPRDVIIREGQSPSGCVPEIFFPAPFLSLLSSSICQGS